MKIRDRIKSFRRVPAKDLAPNPRNWRTHPKAQREALRGILAEVGFADACLARELPDGSLRLVDGHLRTETTPDQKIPTLILNITDEEERKLLAVLDPLASMAEADGDALGGLLREVQTDSDGLKGLLDGLASDHGIDLFAAGGEEEAPEPQIDRAAELQAEWKTELGQVWEIPGKVGSHRLLCGDATKAEDMGRVSEDGQIGMVFTDPPYGIAYDATATGRSKRDWGRIEGDDLAGSALEKFYRDFLEQILVHLVDDGVLYVCGAVRTAHRLIAAAEASGIHYAVPLVWVKQHFALNWDRYHPQHEFIFYGGPGSVPTGTKSRWFGPKNETTVWNISRDAHRDYTHPTQKPVELPERAIRNSTTKDDVVLDPFLGSGTTMVAAEQLGRICYGIEIEPKYVAVALQRMKDMRLSPTLCDQGGGQSP